MPASLSSPRDGHRRRFATNPARRLHALSARTATTSSTATYLQLFNQIWNDEEKVDVTAAICDHIESVYQETSPERIYFQMLYNLFRISWKTSITTCCPTT